MLPESDTEIVFVDDSTDDTPDVIRAAASTFPIPITVHHGSTAPAGLGGAVVEACGWPGAPGSW
ncbi:hypothetical protein GCM10020358_43690 [Amorphoplanes nipponensis]|uniref:hypothetical protein n=1 Tax=Actinoplanes nipponensis TaxID=135950 RepID=UPI0031EE1B9B